MPRSNNTCGTVIKNICCMFQQCLEKKFSFLKTNKKYIKAHSTERSAFCGSIYNLQIKGFSTEIFSLCHFMIEEPSVDLRTMYESQNFLRMEQLTGDQTITRFVDEIMYNQNITIKLCVDRNNIYRQNKRLIYEYSI